MARHDRVDEELLGHLAAISGDPVITATVPSHRWGPDTAQDRVLLLDTVDRLGRTPGLAPWREGEAAAERLRREALQVDLQHALDGVIVYANAHVSGHLTVPGAVATRVAVGRHVALVPVVRAVRQRFPALVVGVADSSGRAWRKEGLTLTEVVDEHFPFELPPDDHRHGDRWEFGRQQSTLEATHRLQVVREFDHRVAAVLGATRVPVFLAGSPKVLAGVSADSRLPVGLEPLRLGVMNHPTSGDLMATARQLDDHLRARWATRRRRDVDDAVGAKRLAGDLDEITELVHDGNAATLLLDEAWLRSVDDPLAGRLDHLVATMLSRGDDVDVVESATLDPHGPHALVTRY